MACLVAGSRKKAVMAAVTEVEVPGVAAEDSTDEPHLAAEEPECGSMSRDCASSGSCT